MQEVVNSNKKTNDDWGLQGYTIPKFNAHLDKPPNVKIMKSKQNDFLSGHAKLKAWVPGPQYEVSGSMIMTKNISISKLPKITFA